MNRTSERPLLPYRGLLILFLGGALTAGGSENVFSYSKWASIPPNKNVSIRLLRPLCAQVDATKFALESLPPALTEKLKRAESFKGRKVDILPSSEAKPSGLLLEVKPIDVLSVPGIPTVTTGLLGGAPGMVAVAGRLVDADKDRILMTFEDTRIVERTILHGGDRAFIAHLANLIAEDIVAMLEERHR